MIKIKLVILILGGFFMSAFAQFAPPAGQPGTTAVHKDSSAIVNWANTIIEFNRGASDIANGWGTLASFGTEAEALGYAQGNSTNVVSLGDSGSITLSFPFPIMNEPGNDFAVFENSFDDQYLEFAFVEVSSDGIRFVRFPSTSLTQTTTQTATFAYSDATLIHNLAGKYRQGYGTPFDLEDLVDSSGINLDSVRFVRIVDVIGTIDPAYGSYDAYGNLVNDPYPSDFAAGGFDLDGVGVMHENNIYARLFDQENTIRIQQSVNGNVIFIQSDFEIQRVKLTDLSGKTIYEDETDALQIVLKDLFLQTGTYILYLETERGLMSRLVLF